MENSPSAPTQSPWLKVLRVAIAVLAIVVGGLIVLVTAAVGHCSAFGGRCPRPNTFDADVFRSTAMGTILAVGAALSLRRPSWRGLLRSIFSAVLVAIPTGALVMIATQG